MLKPTLREKLHAVDQMPHFLNIMNSWLEIYHIKQTSDVGWIMSPQNIYWSPKSSDYDLFWKGSLTDVVKIRLYSTHVGPDPKWLVLLEEEKTETEVKSMWRHRDTKGRCLSGDGARHWSYVATNQGIDQATEK